MYFHGENPSGKPMFYMTFIRLSHVSTGQKPHLRLRLAQQQQCTVPPRPCADGSTSADWDDLSRFLKPWRNMR